MICRAGRVNDPRPAVVSRRWKFDSRRGFFSSPAIVLCLLSVLVSLWLSLWHTNRLYTSWSCAMQRVYTAEAVATMFCRQKQFGSSLHPATYSTRRNGSSALDDDCICIENEKSARQTIAILLLPYLIIIIQYRPKELPLLLVNSSTYKHQPVNDFSD